MPIIINSGSGEYIGRKFDVQLSAELRHKDQPIFEKFFDAKRPEVVDLEENAIFIPNHFFRTGEKLTYEYDGFLNSSENAVGIASTEIPNVGFTTYLPQTVYAVKINDRFIKLSATKEESLRRIPKTLDLNALGFGTYHKFIGEKQNTRSLITIDNVIQSPAIDTVISTTLENNLSGTEDLLRVAGITSFFTGDLIRIDDEIMRINYVSFEGENNFIVRRPMLGTKLADHPAGRKVVKLSGNYQISDNIIYFPVAPFEKNPTTDFERSDPEDRDYVGLETFSTFSGRVFLRSGFEDTSIGPYDKNFLLDDISAQFTGISTQAVLTEQGNNISGFSTGNALVLINNVFQTPDFIDYGLSETSGITTIKFTGNPSTNPEDINTSSLPRGGIIVSVGTKPGYGYQPLVAAGGTAKVSAAGTIESISIGYTGSGYRAEQKYIFDTKIKQSTFAPNGGNFYLKNKNGLKKKLDYLFPESTCKLFVKDSLGRNLIENNDYNEITSLSLSGQYIDVGISNPVDAWSEIDSSSGYVFVKSTTATQESGISTSIIQVSDVSGINTTSLLAPYYLSLGNVAKNIEIIDVDSTNNKLILQSQTTGSYIDNSTVVIRRYESGIDQTNINDIAYLEVTNPNVGIANIYVNVLKEYPVENSVYTHTTGIVTITSDDFSTSPGEIVEIKGLIYKCNSGGTFNNPSPTFNKRIGISSITVNNKVFSVSNATYDPISGISTITIGSHSLPIGGRILIEPESLGFTCDLDGNTETTYYPRIGDPAYNKTVEILNTTSTSIKVNVGSGGSNTSIHTFDQINALTPNPIRYSTGIATVTTDGNVSNTLKSQNLVLFKDTNTFLDDNIFTVQSSPIVFGSNTNSFTIDFDELLLPSPSSNQINSSGYFTLATLEFPSGNLGNQFEVLYTNENTFTLYVGETIFEHIYVGGGTVKNITRGKELVHIGISTITNGHLNPADITNTGVGFTNYNTLFETNLRQRAEAADFYFDLGRTSGINTYTDYISVGTALTDVKIVDVDFNSNRVWISDALINDIEILTTVIIRRYDPLNLLIDDPLSYFNLDLIYSDDSAQGIGSYAKADIVVSNDGSVSQFELKTLGSSYGQGEILTVEVGGVTGIPTFSSLIVSEITNEVGFFTGSLSTLNDRFGFSVSSSDDGSYVIVGSPYDEHPNSENNSGVAYIFDRVGAGYTQVGILTGLYSSNSEDNFGYSVAMSGDGTKIAVGSPNDEYPGSESNSGIVYMFDRSSGPVFTNVGIITGSYSSNAEDAFGSVVDMSFDGNVIVVGSLRDERPNSENQSGIVYIYERQNSPTIGFNTVGILTGLYAYHSEDQFGNSLSLSSDGKHLIIGAIGDEYLTDNPVTDYGVVYVYEDNGVEWERTGIITSPNPSNVIQTTGFGYSVEISDTGNILAIGAITDNSGIGGSNSGIVYIYEKIENEYYLIQILRGLYANNTDDKFGSSISMSNDGKLIAIGTKEDEYPNLGNSSGIVYVYERITENYFGNDYVNVGILTGFYARSLNDNFGTSVKLSPDGTSLIVGSQYDSFNNVGLGTSGVVSTFDLIRKDSFDEFQVLIDQTFTDSFSGYVFGDLIVFDSFDRLFNGKRVEFPLKIGGLRTTLRARPGSNLELQYNLIVFINDIYQVPEASYTFSGGSIITFTEPPKQGDKCIIVFYYGTTEVDTRNVDVLETIKIGDNVTVNSNVGSLQQLERTVTDILSTDIIETNVYQSNGVTLDPNLKRPVTWCKQLYDKIINGVVVGKSRDPYEPEIYPRAQIIQSVGIGTTEKIFVENVKIFFDSDDEYAPIGILKNPQKDIVLVSNDTIKSAQVSVSVGNNLRISSVNIIDGGLGYSESPDISISYPSFSGIGTTSFERAQISCEINSLGIVTSVSLINPGYGYTNTESPLIHVGPPTIFYEKINRVSYSGDFGWITGIGTTSTQSSNKNFIFELYIPENSYLRDSIYGNAIQKSTIQQGYYFKVSNSGIGNTNNGIVSLDNNGNIISYGSSFLDGIYYAKTVGYAITEVPGLSVGFGRTEIVRVTVPVSSYNGLDVASGGSIGTIGGNPNYKYGEYIGDFSWGLIDNLRRTNPKEFKYYNNGIVGLSTSASVIRDTKLKSLGYTENI